MFKLVVIASLQNVSNIDRLGVYSLSALNNNALGSGTPSLNSVDDYNEDITPCEDFYSKVCSLFDVENDDDLSVPRGGTFRTMVHDNSRIIEKIVKTYPQYSQCKRMVTQSPPSSSSRSHNTLTENNSYSSLYWSKVEKYIKDENIQTLFDIYVHGGLSPFIINFDAKVLNDSKYCTELDVNFEFYYFIVYKVLGEYEGDTMLIDLVDGSKIELQDMLKELYTRLDMSHYPSNLVDYIKAYQKIEHVTDKYLHSGLIDLLSLSSEDTIMMNRQEAFFSYIFEVIITKKLPITILQRLLAYEFINAGLNTPSGMVGIKDDRRNDESASLSTELLDEEVLNDAIASRNLMWAKLNHHHKIITKRTITERDEVSHMPHDTNAENNLDTVASIGEHFCLTQIRDTFLVDINSKFYQATNIKTQANYIEYLVKDIIRASSAFFGRTNLNNNAHSASFDEDEYLIHIGPRTASRAKYKMDEIVVNSMASISNEASLLLLELSKHERDVLLEEDYPSCVFSAKTRMRAGLESSSRSGHFLSDRKNATLAQIILWTTVKAETVNAWYDPTSNTITIPIGIARYPLFRGDYTYDVSFLGAVIGHELGHATDSSGNQFNEIGSYVNGIWWDPKDITYLDRKTSCLARDYGHPCGNDDYGHHTLGEDMADQFGLRMVLSIAKDILLNTTLNVDAADHLDLSQMLKNINKDVFINFARVWCGRSTFRQECDNVQHDVHALAKDRVIRTLRQFKTFSDAFGCKTDAPMVNTKRCIVY
jgi:hypothetical protein